MIKNKKILAVVPARGGSKGVPLKNIAIFHGRPLIEWTAQLIRSLDFVDQAIVSTDHGEIASIAEAAGLPSPFIRPAELSGDRVSDFSVISHALEVMEKQDRVAYDVVLMLQPTSPYRNPPEILGVVQKLVEENLDSVVTVSEAPLTFHPFKQFKKVGQYLKYVCEEGESVIARQQLFPTYFRNGIAYAVTRDCLKTQKKIIGEKAGAFLTDHPFVNIDSLDDFALGESMTSPSVTSDT